MFWKHLERYKNNEDIRFSNGDELYHYKKALVFSTFCGPRDVLSTGPNNGGFRKDLEAVFNVDISF